MKLSKKNLSGSEYNRIGIVGHVGVGHSHSADGLIQDDSAGFAVVSQLMKRCIPVDLTINTVDCDHINQRFTVSLKGGGVGSATARCGITPIEAELSKRIIGLDASFCHKAAYHAFGRCYGQGVDEVPTALEGAIALAVADTFLRCGGDIVEYANCGSIDQEDCAIGVRTELDHIPLSLMLVINMTRGGIGPAEDLEGNADFGFKGEVMVRLGLDHIPTIVVESKAFLPSRSPSLEEPKFLIRFRDILWEPIVASAIESAARALKISAEAMELNVPQNYLKNRTCIIADRLIFLGEKLKQAETAAEKVKISAALAKLVREDMGSVTFMSNSVYDIVGGCGVKPGSGAVLSLLTDGTGTKYGKFPIIESHDVDQYCKIILQAAQLLYQCKPKIK